jgi:hypothetical protein
MYTTHHLDSGFSWLEYQTSRPVENVVENPPPNSFYGFSYLYYQLLESWSNERDTFLTDESKDNILRLAYSVFGNTPLFTTWLNVQSVNAIRHQFLEETIEYIKTRKRTTSFQTYLTLISGSKNTNNYTKTYNSQLECRIVISPSLSANYRMNARFADVISLWTMDDAGYIDLFMTLHVMLYVHARNPAYGTTNNTLREQMFKNNLGYATTAGWSS